MGKAYLGIDVGSSKTHALIVDEAGRLLGFGRGGPGNHEGVGNDGFVSAVQTAMYDALHSASLQKNDLAGAGFGISGLDWPFEEQLFRDLLGRLQLPCPFDLVNDSSLGLLAAAGEGWGVAVVSGTGCNCHGWTRGRARHGQVTGCSTFMGEGAGGSEIVGRAIQMAAYEWTKRGPTTTLSRAFIEHVGASDLEDLLMGLTNEKYDLDADAAPIVFACARAGDPVAQDVIHWAGNELGELAVAVIHQLELENVSFDVVMIGSQFQNGEIIQQPMRDRILQTAPGARLIHLNAPPVVGAAILALEAAGIQPSAEIKDRLIAEVKKI